MLRRSSWRIIAGLPARSTIFCAVRYFFHRRPCRRKRGACGRPLEQIRLRGAGSRPTIAPRRNRGDAFPAPRSLPPAFAPFPIPIRPFPHDSRHRPRLRLRLPLVLSRQDPPRQCPRRAEGRAAGRGVAIRAPPSPRSLVRASSTQPTAGPSAFRAACSTQASLSPTTGVGPSAPCRDRRDRPGGRGTS